MTVFENNLEMVPNAVFRLGTAIYGNTHPNAKFRKTTTVANAPFENNTIL